MWTPNGRGGCCYEVLHAHIMGERTWTHTWYPAKTVWACVVPSRQNRYGNCGENRIFGHFVPIFGILTLRGSIFKGFMMMFNGVYMRLPVMMVTLGVSWNIKRGPGGPCRSTSHAPGHFRPIRIIDLTTPERYSFTQLENECKLHNLKYRKSSSYMIKAIRDHYGSKAHSVPSLEVDERMSIEVKEEPVWVFKTWSFLILCWNINYFKRDENV